jgi:hypothetical protein
MRLPDAGPDRRWRWQIRSTGTWAGFLESTAPKDGTADVAASTVPDTDTSLL